MALAKQKGLQLLADSDLPSVILKFDSISYRTVWVLSRMFCNSWYKLVATVIDFWGGGGGGASESPNLKTSLIKHQLKKISSRSLCSSVYACVLETRRERRRVVCLL